MKAQKTIWIYVLCKSKKHLKLNDLYTLLSLHLLASALIDFNLLLDASDYTYAYNINFNLLLLKHPQLNKYKNHSTQNTRKYIKVPISRDSYI